MKTYILPVLFIVIFGIIIRLFYFEFTIGSDDQRYILSARALDGGVRPDIHPVYYSRILWSTVLWVWGKFFGTVSLLSSTVLMCVFSGLTGIFVAEATRLEYGRSAALVAAAFYMAHPLTVLFDIYTIPDNLGVTLLAASIYAFVLYLKQLNQARYIFLSGSLIGATLAVKSYFILAALPLGLVLLTGRYGWIIRIRKSMMFSTGFLLGAASDPLLNFVVHGDVLAHMRVLSDYGERLAAIPSDYSGLRYMVVTVLRRFDYLREVFLGFGVVVGVAQLWTVLFTIRVLRSDHLARGLGGMIVLFLLFLSFMPVHFSPLIFIQMADRYLIVLLPAMAIMSGPALMSVFDSLHKRGLGSLAAAMAAILVAYNLVIPNGMQDQYRILEHVGLRLLLSNAGELGIEELGVSRRKKTELPDSYYDRGVKITFLDFQGELASENISKFLRSNERRVVFVPRSYRSLVEPLRIGEGWDRIRYGENWYLIKLFISRGISAEPVSVPYTPIRRWLSRLGVQTKGQVVGWLLRYKSAQPLDG